MPGRFPNAWLDDLYARADIVQIVSAYVPLKKNGSRYWGLCPFHHEKTPSFSVNAELNLYYCFGCKAGGNAVNFIQEMERLSYSEAVTYIAEQLHMPIPEEHNDPDYETRRSQRERLLAANLEAAKWYHSQLWQTGNEKLLEYFHNRGLSDGIIRKFGLGAAPDSWDAVTDHLERKGFTTEELQLAGITVIKSNKRYDMFRNRVIFPIINIQSQVLGFGGRTTGDNQPKYLNTSDTPVFNKRKGVFAANFLKKERSLKRIILVEGYMDVVSLMQFGVTGVVATLGTALTNEQARFLKKYAPEIWVSYDGDSAGQHAIMRALDIFEQEDITARVLFFPDKLDPDEFIRQRGLDAFNQLRPLRAAEYRLARAKEDLNLGDEEGRMEYAKRSAQILKNIQEPIELEHYLQTVAVQTGYSREVLQQQMGMLHTAENQKVPSMKPYSYKKKDHTENDITKAEKNLIAILASGLAPNQSIRAEDFDSERLKKLAGLLLSGKSPAVIISETENEDERQFLSDLFATEIEISDENVTSIIAECLNKIRIKRLQVQVNRINEDIKTASDAEKRKKLNELMQLNNEIKRLKAMNN